MLLTKLKKIKYEVLVFVLFVASRLPDLGYDMFNTDVWKWKQRIFDFGSGFFYFDFAKTIQKYHPGVILMWLGSAAVKVFNFWYKLTTGELPPDNQIYTIFELHFVQKLVVVIAIGFTLAFVYNALKKIVDQSYALLAVFLLALEPFYVALTRVIHLEGLLSTFMLASFLWMYVYLTKKKTKLRLFISALFAAAAILTKSSSMFLLPFTGIVMFLMEYLKSRKFGESVKNSLITYVPWLLVVIVVFVSLWPAMLVVPGQALQTLFMGVFSTGIEEGHTQLFFGKLVEDPGLIFYPIVFFYRSSVYLFLGLLAFPFIKKGLTENEKKFALYVFLFGFLYFVEMSIPSKKLDRYILPTIVSFILLSSFSVRTLIDWLSKKIKYAWILVLLPMVACVAYWHPNYFAFYSPLGGGLKVGVNVIEPKWIFGQKEIQEYFLQVYKEDNLTGFGDQSLTDLYWKQELKQKLMVAIPEKYYTQLWPFIRQIDGWATIESLSQDAKQSNYFIYPVWDEKMSQVSDSNFEYRDTIHVEGVPIFNVYNRYDKPTKYPQN